VSKQITIEVSDDKYDSHPLVVGAILGDATFLDAKVRVEDIR